MTGPVDVEPAGAQTETSAPALGTPGTDEMRRQVTEHAIGFLDAMPVAVFVVDAAARVVFANERLLSMVGRTPTDLIGVPMHDVLDDRDARVAATFLTSAPSHGDRVLGPQSMRYVDADGVSHHTQFWARRTPADFGIDGHIVTAMPESVRDVLAEALSTVASTASLEKSLGAVVSAIPALPLDGLGTLLVVEPTAPTDEERFTVTGTWPLEPSLINAFGTPWRRCMVMNEAEDVNEFAVDARIGAEMAMAKLRAAWVCPVRDPAGEVAAVLIVWRTSASAQSDNQREQLADIVRLAELAFDKDRSRRAREYEAHRDALTGVGNRPSFNDRIELEQHPANVLFIDLDHFRTVNDTFGHAVGDEVIAQVGRRIAATVRARDDVYRSGGDQFVVVCDPEVPDGSGAMRLAERLVERLAAPFDCAEHRVRISATIGVANGRPSTDTARSLTDAVDAARRAMDIAKERGRGCVHHADFVT